MIPVSYIHNTKEVFVDNDSLFIPRKGEIISFKNVETNLDKWYDNKNFKVVNVEYSFLPHRAKVFVYDVDNLDI